MHHTAHDSNVYHIEFQSPQGARDASLMDSALSSAQLQFQSPQGVRDASKKGGENMSVSHKVSIPARGARCIAV